MKKRVGNTLQSWTLDTLYDISAIYVMFFWWSDINGCDGCKQYDMIERQHGHDNQPNIEFTHFD